MLLGEIWNFSSFSLTKAKYSVSKFNGTFVPVNWGSSKEWNLISIKLPDSINGFNNESYNSLDWSKNYDALIYIENMYPNTLK